MLNPVTHTLITEVSRVKLSVYFALNLIQNLHWPLTAVIVIKTDPLEQSYSRKADSPSGSQEVPRII
jgi:hypothetical protein